MNSLPITFFGSILGPNCVNWSEDNRISILTCDGLIILVPKYHYLPKPFNSLDSTKLTNDSYSISNWLEIKLNLDVQINDREEMWDESAAINDPYLPYPSNTGSYLKSEWSPRGLGNLNKCILSTINYHGQLVLFDDVSNQSEINLMPKYEEILKILPPPSTQTITINQAVSVVRFTSIQWSFMVDDSHNSSQALLALGDNNGRIHIYQYNTKTKQLELIHTYESHCDYISHLSWSRWVTPDQGPQSCILSFATSSGDTFLSKVEMNPFSFTFIKQIQHDNPSVISSMKFLNTETDDHSTKLCYAKASKIHLLHWSNISDPDNFQEKIYSYGNFHPITDIIWNDDSKSILLLNHLDGLNLIHYDSDEIKKVSNKQFNQLVQMIQTQLGAILLPKTSNDQETAADNDNDAEVDQEGDLGQTQSAFPFWYGLTTSPSKGQICVIFEWSNAVSDFIPDSGTQSGLMILPIHSLIASNFTKWIEDSLSLNSISKRGAIIEDLSYIIAWEAIKSDESNIQSYLLKLLDIIQFSNPKNWLGLLYMLQILFPNLELMTNCNVKYKQNFTENLSKHIDSLCKLVLKSIEQHPSHPLTDKEISWFKLMNIVCTKLDKQPEFPLKDQWKSICESQNLNLENYLDNCPICSEKIELNHPKKAICSLGHRTDRCTTLFTLPQNSSQQSHICTVCKSVYYLPNPKPPTIPATNDDDQNNESESGSKRRKLRTGKSKSSQEAHPTDMKLTNEPDHPILDEVFRQSIQNGCVNCGHQLI